MSGFEKMQKLQPALHSAYESIRGRWAALAEKMRELAGPASGSIVVGENEEKTVSLAWGRCHGNRTFYLRTVRKSDNHETVTPFDEWSFRQQITLLEEVDRLSVVVAECLAQIIVDASKV